MVNKKDVLAVEEMQENEEKCKVEEVEEVEGAEEVTQEQKAVQEEEKVEETTEETMVEEIKGEEVDGNDKDNDKDDELEISNDEDENNEEIETLVEIEDEEDIEDENEEEKTLQLEEQERDLTSGPTLNTGRINPLRMYDERERTISMESWQLVYDAANPSHKGILEFPAVDISKYGKEDCLIIYIPNIQEGVEGILPKSRAGLIKGEKLESLMQYPTIRVTPVHIDREKGYCILDRELANTIQAKRTWAQVNEGNDVDAMVLGIQRIYSEEAGRKVPKQAILDVGGIISVMPVSEVAHGFVYDINYRKGDLISVRVIQKREIRHIGSDGKEIVKRKFIVSKKAQVYNPWLDEKLIPNIGNCYSGEITHISERYVHIKLPSGFEVFTSRPSLNYKGRENIEIGRWVRVYITRVNKEKQLIMGNLSPREAAKDIRRFKRIDARNRHRMAVKN